jgi:hypothetical protein
MGLTKLPFWPARGFIALSGPDSDDASYYIITQVGQAEWRLIAGVDR